MKTSEAGTIEFDRLFNKVSNNNKVVFSLDLVAHENDWRSALQWFRSGIPAM